MTHGCGRRVPRPGHRGLHRDRPGDDRSSRGVGSSDGTGAQHPTPVFSAPSRPCGSASATLSGDLDQVLARMEAAVQELERSDPLNRRLYFLGTLGADVLERGYPIRRGVCMRCAKVAGGGAVPILVDSTRLGARCSTHSRAAWRRPRPSWRSTKGRRRAGGLISGIWPAPAWPAARRRGNDGGLRRPGARRGCPGAGRLLPPPPRRS